MKKFETVIVGGGFSGLIAALVLSEKLGGERVAVVERNDRVGKKLLATGNGRGNLTNVEVSNENYHSESGADVSNALKKYGNKSIIEFFGSLGAPCVEEGGKVYPKSLQASSVLDLIRLKAAYLKTEIITNFKCEKIEKTNDGFLVYSEGEVLKSNSVVFACGGKSGKQYGTDGTAFEILRKLGHSTTRLSPQIVQLKTETGLIKGLKGVKEKVEATAMDGERRIKSFCGDVLFTEYGVSGNAVFYLSSYLSELNDPRLSLSFWSDDERSAFEFLSRKARALPFIGIDDILTGVVNKQIGRAIARSVGATSLDDKTLLSLARALKDFRLKVVGSLGFDYSQVTRGGIPFFETTENFESKKAKGLFIIGEALDVDGDCGGYNLQWAYTSARVAADEILKRTVFSDENR